MPVTVTLGRDCVITGFDNASVRSVTWSSSAKEVECQPFGGRAIVRHNCGYDCVVDIEMLQDGGAVNTLQSGATMSISGSGYSGQFVVTNVVRSEPLDDVVSIRVTAKLTFP